jgi:hypothetical protein
MEVDIDSYLGSKKVKRADVVLEFLLFLFSDDLQYRSKEALVELVKGIFDLVDLSFGYKVNAFYSRKKESFQGKISKQSRDNILSWIYNNMLSLEGMGLLHGFGVTDKFGDRLWGNPEYQSIYDMVPGVMGKEN